MQPTYNPKYPLFWCISVANQAKLMQLHFDLSGEKLDIPPEPDTTIVKHEIIVEDTTEEIGREMRKAPSRSRGL